MAILKKGILGESSGKVGPIVTYVSKGRHIMRSYRKKRSKSSVGELASREATRLITPVLLSVKRFIKVGFQLEAALKNTNYYNEAYRYNRKAIVAGSYPEQYLDLSNLQVTIGEKPIANGVHASLNGAYLEFRWNMDAEKTDTKDSDQLILVAYCETPRVVIGVVGGQLRKQGFGRLEVVRFERTTCVFHTFMAFISEDRSSISNTMYAGQVVVAPDKG